MLFLFILASNSTTMKMKIAPKRFKKALGGDVYGNAVTDDGDKDKKKVAQSTGVNTDAKSANQQMAAKGLINKSTANMNESTARAMTASDDNTKKYSDVSGVSGAGGKTLPKEPYQNELGTYVPSTNTQYDKAGNVIPKKAKGGIVMKKCPMMKKGGKC